MLYISDKAQKYFTSLLKQRKKGTQIRIFLKKLNAIHLECSMCYYFPENNNTNDIKIKFNYFSVYIDKTIISLIKDTKIDVISNKLGTHLSIHAPHLNTVINNPTKHIKHKSSLTDQIKHVLDFQINPQLSMHGGKVSLIRITEDSLVILKFYGGCNGCAMAAYTIKEGIENTLKKLFPELKGVVDITQHERGNHSYY